MAKSNRRTEFGDYQTPRALAAGVCEVLARMELSPSTVIEPTCGEGSLLVAALDRFPSIVAAIGLDVDARYIASVRNQVSNRAISDRVKLVCGSFFTADWPTMLRHVAEPLLVIGNPPWVTNAALGTMGSENLPQKINFQNQAGLDAMTGKSNFDLSESMLIQVMEWLNGRNGTMAMLCKTAVARKLLAYAWKNCMGLGHAALYGIDAETHFGAAVDACLLVCGFQPGCRHTSASVFPSLESQDMVTNVAWRDGHVVANADAFDRWSHLAANGNAGLYGWRSGVKHDCAAVMQLRREAGRWHDKLGRDVDIESTYLYPMLKGSEVAHGRTSCPTHWMLVTQATVGAQTNTIADHAPKTWAYLHSRSVELDARRSSIYRNRPQFSVFGVGDYTFAPYKVAISGLYKRLRFEVVGSYEGKPVVFDDTVYFLGCRTGDEAVLLAELLNSNVAREFYSAFVFWDAKRPITAEVLRQVDLRKLARSLDRVREFDEHAFGENVVVEQARLF